MSPGTRSPPETRAPCLRPTREASTQDSPQPRAASVHSVGLSPSSPGQWAGQGWALAKELPPQLGMSSRALAGVT